MEILVRKASIDDAKDIFNLANDPIVRANSINSSEILWNDHISWFNNKLKSSQCKFYVFLLGKEFIGHAHIDLYDNEWEISIYLKNEYRGKGFGLETLNLLCVENKGVNLTALVKETNIPSNKLFQKALFIQKEQVYKNGLILNKYSKR